MTDRSGNANVSATRNEPYNLGAPDRWSEPVFRDFILEGIRRDGFGEEEIALVQNVFSKRPVASASEFIALLEERAGGSLKTQKPVQHPQGVMGTCGFTF